MNHTLLNLLFVMAWVLTPALVNAKDTVTSAAFGERMGVAQVG